LSKINNESAINLKRAKLIWSGAQSKSSIEEILTLLGKINPASTSFGELDSFLADINKKIESSILRDYQERQEIRKQEIEREKLQVELEKSQMQATKDIAIAYASGTHITNNYTSNAYSSSYSSSNYLSRYYDVLIW
jgi:F0F1-type ATP synthase delta subunit